MPERDLGTLSRHGDEWTLTYVRRFAHRPETVWRAVSEPEHLASWFPHRIEGERRAGAPLRFVSDFDDGFDGEMLVYDPPSVIEMRWGVDRLRIEVRPDGDGTVLTLTDTLRELGKAARDGAGWHECLDRLDAFLDGVAPVPWGEPWTALNASYTERFGPEAATIGPPAGWDEAMAAEKRG